MRYAHLATGTILAVLAGVVPAQADMLNLKGYKLTFDEEFNHLSVSQNGEGTTWTDIRSQWRYDASSDIGFGKSSFLDAASGYSPFLVHSGVMTITGIPYTFKSGYPGSWQSGLIHSEGSFVQSYGYFEMRAKFNSVPGTWPAFWLLPVTAVHPAGRDASLWQELDVVEQYGSYTQGVYSNIHTTEPAPPGIMWNFFSSHPEIANGYHTYGMDWEPKTITFYVDGVLMGSKPTPDDMTGPMYMLVDLARDTPYPDNAAAMTMDVDYVRAFSKAAHAVAVRQAVVSAPDGHDPGLHGATVATTLPPDRLAITLYETASQGDGQILVSVDDVAIGGVRTITGTKAAPQTFTVPASFAQGTHEVSVLLVNPSISGTGPVRRVFIKDIKINGTPRGGAADLSTTTADVLTVTIP